MNTAQQICSTSRRRSAGRVAGQGPPFLSHLRVGRFLPCLPPRRANKLGSREVAIHPSEMDPARPGAIAKEAHSAIDGSGGFYVGNTVDFVLAAGGKMSPSQNAVGWVRARAGRRGGAVVGHFSVFSQVSDATAVVPAVPAGCLGRSLDGRSS